MTRSAGASGGLDSLPGEARLWVFGTDRRPTPDEEALLLSRVDAFLEGWRAHGRPLAAAREWRYGRFLLIGVDESVAPPTGCSIDALVRTLGEVEVATGLRLLDRDPIWYRPSGPGAASGEGIRRVSRAEFREAGARGEVTTETVVFDPAVTRVGEARAGRWERPAGEGWHRRLLPDGGRGASAAG